MPGGGELSLETRDVTLDEAFCRTQPPPLAPGPYLLVTVRDTGCGMDEETKRRLFEPFFTTKPAGQGTGMGLAAVYGTARGHRGTVTISSELGRGTTVSVYLPSLAKATETPADPAAPAPPAATAHARILVVDDEADVREVAVAMLRAAGHEPLVAEDGPEALARYEQSFREIDLVLLDLVMPGMAGRDVFRALRRINPQARVLVASGYSFDGAAQGLLADGARGFVQKPFRIADLTAAVAAALRG